MKKVHTYNKLKYNYSKVVDKILKNVKKKKNKTYYWKHSSSLRDTLCITFRTELNRNTQLYFNIFNIRYPYKKNLKTKLLMYLIPNDYLNNYDINHNIHFNEISK